MLLLFAGQKSSNRRIKAKIEKAVLKEVRESYLGFGPRGLSGSQRGGSTITFDLLRPLALRPRRTRPRRSPFP